MSATTWHWFGEGTERRREEQLLRRDIDVLNLQITWRDHEIRRLQGERDDLIAQRDALREQL